MSNKPTDSTDTPVYADTPAGASWPDPAQMMLNGVQVGIELSRLETARKRGVFRGGSAGILLDDGTAAGTCIRAAAARFLGAEPERDPVEWQHKQLMFEHGYMNEDAWFANLERAGHEFRYMREEEFSIAWCLSETGGTGREDIILCDSAGNPTCLLELKAVCSLSTAQTVLLKAQPKLENAIQVGNYMLRTGLPGVLAYTNRMNISVPDWGFLKALLPRNPSDTQHHAFGYCKWSAGGRSGPQVTAIEPFVARYKLRWRAGRLEWAPYETSRSDGGWVPTPVTASNIDRFYSATKQMIDSRQLAAPHIPMEIDGTPIKRFKSCDYCDWQYVCERAGDDFDVWHSQVSRLAEEAIADAEAADAAASQQADSNEKENSK